MNQEDRTKVVQNYYKAQNALMAIGTTDTIPEELKQLAIKSSATVSQIIEYINSHRE